VKLRVAENMVVMRLGTNEQASQEMAGHARPCVHEEMVAADDGGTGSEIAGGALVVENCGLRAKSRHKIGAHSPIDARRVHSVDVIQDRAIVLITVVQRAMVAERTFDVEAEMILENRLDAGGRIRSTPFGRSYTGLRRAGGSGGEKCAAAGSDINLLSPSNAYPQEEHAGERERSELSQSTSSKA